MYICERTYVCRDIKPSRFLQSHLLAGFKIYKSAVTAICTHQLILIRRDGGENGLREDERLVLLLLEVGDVQAAVVGVPTPDQVYPRLIPVHRVQHDLQQRDGEIIRRSIIAPRD